MLAYIAAYWKYSYRCINPSFTARHQRLLGAGLIQRPMVTWTDELIEWSEMKMVILNDGVYFRIDRGTI